ERHVDGSRRRLGAVLAVLLLRGANEGARRGQRAEASGAGKLPCSPLCHSTMRKSENSPVKPRQRVSTLSTRAALGPFWAQLWSSRMLSSSPSARSSTDPSGRFLTQPESPSRRASLWAAALK